MTASETASHYRSAASRRGDARAPLPGERFDAVIVGAGAAGLSLACHLAHSGWGSSVLVVDDGSYPLDQRSWAWWTTGGGLLDSAASTAVEHLTMAGSGWARTARLAPYSYRAIGGSELSAVTDRFMAARAGYRRVEGSVCRLIPQDDNCAVEIDVLDSGTTRTVQISARWVFDSVGLLTSDVASTAVAQLDFLGLHVECPTDTFDAGSVTLMDFRTDQAPGLAFMYVLPTSARSALVERTVFAQPGPYDPDDGRSRHEAHVHHYLTHHLGVDHYRLAGREQGVIPLDRRPRATAEGAVIPIGALAGMVKASTGYGFGRIQRHSAAIADSLRHGTNPAHAAPPHRWNRALDSALLGVIREHPADALHCFESLLTRNPMQRVLAFLDEEASPWSQLQLFATLPLAPFVRAQMRAATRGPAPKARNSIPARGAEDAYLFTAERGEP